MVIAIVLLLLSALSAGIGLAVFKARRELPRCLLLIDGDEGNELVKARRDIKGGGVRYKGTLYPDELIENLGYSTFALVALVEMPADGDTRHPGHYPDVRPVNQSRWRASWVQYDMARRRQNFKAVFERGDGNLTVLKNLAIGVVFLVNLYMGFSLVGLRSETGQLKSSLTVVSGQLARLTGVGSVAVPAGSGVNPQDHSLVPPVPTVPAGPTGDPGRKP